MDFVGVLRELFVKYEKSNDSRLKLIDFYLATVAATLVIEFLYGFLVGSFPFNAYISALFACLGVFVITVSLRMHVGGDSLPNTSDKFAFGEYSFCLFILFLVAINYMG